MDDVDLYEDFIYWNEWWMKVGDGLETRFEDILEEGEDNEDHNNGI